MKACTALVLSVCLFPHTAALADTPAVQTAWLLQTTSEITVEEITDSPELGASVVFFDSALGAYSISGYGVWGWNPSLTISAWQKFIYENPGGGDAYKSWDYGYVGDWSMTAPDSDTVSGNVRIAWLASAGWSPIPGYAAQVTILGEDAVEIYPGYYEDLELDLGVLEDDGEVYWDTTEVANGSYTIQISFGDNPVEGVLGREVASVEKTVSVDNSSASVVIDADPSSWSRTSPEGSADTMETFELSGNGAFSFSITDDADWISCSPSSGSSDGSAVEITVDLDISTLAQGSYDGTITITSAEAANSPLELDVSQVISAPADPSEINLSASLISAACQEDGSSTNITFDVWNSGSESMSYSIADDVPWLTCSPTSGTSEDDEHDTITATFSPSGMSAGVYSGTITVTAADADNSPQTVAVSMTVEDAGFSQTTEQALWLLKTSSGLSVTNITDDPELGAQVYVFDDEVGAYEVAEYQEYFSSSTYTMVFGWIPDSLFIEAGQQFIFNSPSGGDDYLSWPYGYVGNWRLSSPSENPVCGRVPIAWTALEKVVPLPDYAARITITGPGSYEHTFETQWDDGSVDWKCLSVPDGVYTNTIEILDAPASGLAGEQVGSVVCELVLDNSILNPLEDQTVLLVDDDTWDLRPAALEIGASTISNTLTITNGGWVGAASVTVYTDSFIELLAGGALLVEGDFDAGQGGFVYAGGTLEVGGSVSGLSALPAENRLEALEVDGDLTVYGTFSPGRAEEAAAPLGMNAGAGGASSAPGAVINGALTLEAGGSLEMEISGYVQGSGYDHLTVSGAVSLAGALDVVITSGFFPVPGDSFELFDFAGGVSGRFESVNLIGAFGLMLNTNALYTSGTVSLGLSTDDSDADGMADGWEFTYFAGDVSPTNNADSDSGTALQEYVAGTDPTNSDSFFFVEETEGLAEGFAVEWTPSVSGRWYSVSWTNELSGTFQALETNIAFPKNSYTDTLHDAEASGFYRIGVRMED